MQNNDILFIDDNSKTKISVKQITDDYMHLENAYFVPALGTRKFDGHVFVSGATGAGKSYFIRKMVDNDVKKRSCILFTDLTQNDPVFEGMKYIKFDKTKKIDFDWLSKNDTNKIMIFDDIQFNKEIIKYRDIILEKGRHKETIVICVNHKLRDYAATKVPLNDSRFVVTFPASNRGASFRFLKDEIEMDKNIINMILNISVKEKNGHQLIIHRFHPNVIVTAESIFKI